MSTPGCNGRDADAEEQYKESALAAGLFVPLQHPGPAPCLTRGAPPVWLAPKLALRVLDEALQVDGQVAAGVSAAQHLGLQHSLVLLQLLRG